LKNVVRKKRRVEDSQVQGKSNLLFSTEEWRKTLGKNIPPSHRTGQILRLNLDARNWEEATRFAVKRYQGRSYGRIPGALKTKKKEMKRGK